MPKELLDVNVFWKCEDAGQASQVIGTIEARESSQFVILFKKTKIQYELTTQDPEQDQMFLWS